MTTAALRRLKGVSCSLEAHEESVMLTGHSLVYFAQGPWNDLWRPQHQLVSVFAQQNKVLYVERRPYLRPTVAGFHRGELGGQDLHRPALKKVSENLYLHRYPLWAPASGTFPLNQLSRAVMRYSLNRSMRTLGMSDPIVWYSLPSWSDLIDELPSARLKLYHAIDEYTSYINMSENRMRTCERRERTLMAKTDAVIVVHLAAKNACINETIVRAGPVR
jgi:hypothetical protein